MKPLEDIDFKKLIANETNVQMHIRLLALLHISKMEQMELKPLSF
jgi:hypothetical protein